MCSQVNSVESEITKINEQRDYRIEHSIENHMHRLNMALLCRNCTFLAHTKQICIVHSIYKNTKYNIVRQNLSKLILYCS